MAPAGARTVIARVVTYEASGTRSSPRKGVLASSAVAPQRNCHGRATNAYRRITTGASRGSQQLTLRSTSPGCRGDSERIHAVDELLGLGRVPAGTYGKRVSKPCVSRGPFAHDRDTQRTR